MLTRDEENALLRSHGYRWRKVPVGNGREVWKLYNREAQEVPKEIALAHVTSLPIPVPPTPTIDLQAQAEVCRWARTLTSAEYLVLDTETTGFPPIGEVIDIALVAWDGGIVFNSLVKCQGDIPPRATAVHGITLSMLSDAPTLPDVWQTLYEYLESYPVVIYNSSFDTRMLACTSARYHLPMPDITAQCLMQAYAKYAGVRGVKGDLLYQKLEDACRAFSIQPGEHRALGDALATRELLLKLAQA